MAINEESIDIRRYIGIFLSRWWLMLLLPIIGGAAVFIHDRNQEVIYEARATLLVRQRISGFSSGLGDFALSQHLANTYRTLITTTTFLETVIEGHDLPFGVGEFRSMVLASTSSDPPMLNIAVRHKDPVVAAQAADIVAQDFIDYIVEQRLAEIARLQSAAAAQGIVNIQDIVAAQLSAAENLTLLEPVVVPGAPVNPRTEQMVLLGIFVGFVAAAGIAILLESLGDTVKSPDEIGRRFGVTALGSMFRWSDNEAHTEELVLWKAPSSTYAEAFRQIRANIQFATVNHPGNMYLVCSPGPGEGKSTITCNLAIALAQTGKRVVIVDGDLRRATIHKRFPSLRREPGLSNYLADIAGDLNSVIHATEVEGVFVIPSGPTPPNPAELLGSSRMNSLLTQLKESFDYVLVDSAPVLLVADGSIAASQVDGAIVVVDGSHTRWSSLRATLETLQNTRVNIIGVVINKLKRPRFGYGYGYHYYYAYNGYYGTSDSDSGGAALNGNGHKRLHQLPSYWVKTAVSRFQSSRG